MAIIDDIASRGQLTPHMDDAEGRPSVQSGPPVYSLSAVKIS